LCGVIAVLALQAIVATAMIQRVIVAAAVFVAQGKCWKSEQLSPKRSRAF
jgi:hypothetical protein